MLLGLLKMKINEIISELFAVRDSAHMAHLNTDSYAQHKALNEFYDEFLAISDSIIELLIADSGKARGGLQIAIPPSPKASKVMDRADTVLSEIKKITESEAIHNVVDDGLTLVKKTRYLLTLK